MSRPVNINETVTFISNELVSAHSSYSSISGSYPITNAYTNSSSSTYAYITCNTGSGASTYVSLKFPILGIPSNATIESVVCKVKVRVSSTSYLSTAVVQLYNGNTAMGSSMSARTNTATVYTISNPGNWTASTLNNIEIRYTGTRGTSNTTKAAYLYFYGADLTITYSVSGTEYEIISTLATDAIDSIDPAGQTYVMGGNAYKLSIYTDSIDSIAVEDNGNDVTNQLVLTHSTSESSTDTFIPTSFDSVNSIYDGVYNNLEPINGLTSHTDTNRTCVYVEQTAYAEAKLIYNFNCSSIPQNAVITNVTCIAAAACYSNGQYFDIKTLQLYSDNTAKGSAVTITGSGNTSADHNIDGGNWTRAELNNAKIILYIKRGNNTDQASTSFWGATLSVTYTLPVEDYYLYTISNVNADHTIIISDSIIEIPDEDPEYNYYPITVSSINATTEPGRGTIRLVEGSNQTITIVPQDPSITLILDNGQDVSNLLVTVPGPQPSYTVDTAPGASYGFAYSSSTAYYTSQNAGVASSAAVARVSFNLPVRCLVTFQYINYAEATYDFGVFGKIDTTLSTAGWTATDGGGDTTTDAGLEQIRLNTSSSNTANPQTLTYEIPSGTHYIDVKFGKDQASNSNNDTLQFKITNIQELETNNYYTYTLSNIQEQHSLIFIFGDVTYYFVNSSGTNARLFPSGQMVQLPGDTYRITVVPDDYEYDIAVTDNGTDVTSSVERKEEQITKEGVTTTVVNYIYTISNIQATHNIIVSCSAKESLYVKISGAYVKVSKIWKKINDEWNEVALNTLIEPAIYINKSNSN